MCVMWRLWSSYWFLLSGITSLLSHFHWFPFHWQQNYGILSLKNKRLKFQVNKCINSNKYSAFFTNFDHEGYKNQVYCNWLFVLVFDAESIDIQKNTDWTHHLLPIPCQLHDALASLCVSHAGDNRQRFSLKCMFRLKHVIHELGSLEIPSAA